MKKDILSELEVLTTSNDYSTVTMNIQLYQRAVEEIKRLRELLKKEVENKV